MKERAVATFRGWRHDSSRTRFREETCGAPGSRQLDLLERLPERKLFLRADLSAAGLTRDRLERALARGELLHPTLGGNGPERGLWMTPDAEDDPDFQEAAACLLTGGVLCRGYAAARHGLSTDMPGRMELAIPYASNPGRRPYLVVHRTRNVRDVDVLRAGVEAIPTGLGVPIRMTNPARTVVDLLRSKGRVGEEWRHGIDSLRTYLGNGLDTGELFDMARRFGVLDIVETAAEAFNPGGPRP